MLCRVRGVPNIFDGTDHVIKNILHIYILSSGVYYNILSTSESYYNIEFVFFIKCNVLFHRLPAVLVISIHNDMCAMSRCSGAPTHSQLPASVDSRRRLELRVKVIKANIAFEIEMKMKN